MLGQVTPITNGSNRRVPAACFMLLMMLLKLRTASSWAVFHPIVIMTRSVYFLLSIFFASTSFSVSRARQLSLKAARVSSGAGAASAQARASCGVPLMV